MIWKICKQNCKINIKIEPWIAASASSIYGDPDVTLWANECLIMGSDGIEETLFSLDLLYDNLVGSVGEDLGDSDSPATDLNGFILYMRTLQLKG